MPEAKEGCVEPSKGPIVAPVLMEGAGEEIQARKEVKKMTARVGKAAPDFEASAFVDGGFKNVRLSEYKGRWVVLCFYPGDFTFV
jgi:hypothetical protein